VNYILDQPGKNKEHYFKLAFILQNQLKENDTPFFRYLVSSIFYNTGNMEKVVEIMQEIPEKDLSLKNVRVLGAALMELGNFKEALALFEKFDPKKAPFSPDELAIILGIGYSYAGIKNIKKAKEYYARIAQSKPKFPGLSMLDSKIREIEK
jgi:tetratricopeptide (TPR) repeat protein